MDMIPRLQKFQTNKPYGEVRQSVLVALAMTPVLLLPGSVVQVVSIRATVAAVTLSVLLGMSVVVVKEIMDMTNMHYVVLFTGLGSIFVFSILLIPKAYVGTVAQSVITFIWMIPVTEFLIGVSKTA